MNTAIRANYHMFPPYKTTYTIDIPEDIMEKIGWKENDELQIVVKSKKSPSIIIAKKKE
jgi:bifunctional DNA-binding transcriptional regulator/antitoxin component of YhaV-PrlF toxin-antitoxin module